MSEVTSDQFVTFYVAGQLLGIPVDQVREILPKQPITKVPLSPNCISGLINLRGQIVTIIDLRVRLGLDPRLQTNEYMNIIVGDENDLYAIVVDSVGDVIKFDQRSHSSPPPTLNAVWLQCCESVYQMSQGLMIALNVRSLLNLDNLVTNKSA